MTTPRLLSERYELGETLGYGGMSEVHRGTDTRLGRDVAVKVLRADLARDPQFQLRFRREAQNAAALNHPAIVAVYDTGEVSSEFGPLPYIVMEYVDGQTLREIVKTQGPMTQERVIEVMADVCAALDFSHRHSIIHRDVKPANIMINRAGAVKVMDFGIARALGEGQNVTQTAAVIGTAQYLSPEQARGEAVDARSDVYAAGCVLFELLTGEPPFTGDSPVAVAYQHVREDPKRPSALNPQIPPELDAIVLKALSKNPANRYQSAAEMRSDLLRVRNGQRPLAPMVMSDDERTALLAASPTRRINPGGSGGRHTLPPSAVPVWQDEEPPRRTGRKIAIGAGIALVLGLVAFVGYQLLGGPAQPRQVTVPSVIGQQQEAARTAMIMADLRPDMQEAESSPDDIGKVVRTDPAAHSEVPENSAVRIFVGKGPAQVTVPQLKGSTVSDAQRTLIGQGLRLGEQTEAETADSSLIGRIISTTPGPGETAPGGSAVAVVVGKQQTTVAVPDVTGQDESSAKDALEKAGFDVKVTEVDGGNEAGTVVGTSPSAGTRAPKGSTVTLQVSKGNQNSEPVPDVVGMKAQDAAQELADAGYQAVLRGQPVADRSQDNRVIAQNPSAGQTADPNKPVVLTVGQFTGGVFGNGGRDGEN
ncbi:Stk1 family PASTA domain-containing Ser/Thr kinase [Pseudonocardia asaccharolytica]|uniref:non-specific serine/threonine protein kinase n=1 Tax=Pseudonocardia asaccharolytica DSM 44247 = NBRC 16224 TaxID=1123024 RepID=A0A511CW02_9PSEU|nr:Stk1 family PASTA domain-containing Ser/Thr kinase [Pseudonocardia asaccharolytica]GEL16413.1 serine/threonine protein kinase [Pseudonocardia asaccharolytica DSM 44247 = NBRC 16224]